ncbi:extracellular solute-binding protein [Methylobacterium sp. ME121]|nr:extracellular solute-binding protein [Methylobacterium sp. ME121]
MAIVGTTTIRISARTLTQTQPSPSRPWLKRSRACALGRRMPSRSRNTRYGRWSRRSRAPGSSRAASSRRKSPSPFRRADLPPAYVTAWLEGAKRTGVVRRIFDTRGFRDDAAAR